MLDAGPVSRITAAVCSRQPSRFARRRQSSRRRLTRDVIHVHSFSPRAGRTPSPHRPVRVTKSMRAWLDKEEKKSRSAAARSRVVRGGSRTMTSGTLPEAKARTPVRCVRRDRAERDNIFKAGVRRARRALRFRFRFFGGSWEDPFS